MGASVVNGLTASFWAGRKPADYKNQDLDKALKAYEAVAGKTLKIPNDLIPGIPDAKVSAIEDCITKLKSAIAELEKGKDVVNKLVTALKAVQSAASKTSADLIKLSKGKNVDETEYKNAAASANSVGALASDALKDCQ